MTELNNLISLCEDYIKNNNEILENVKYPELLVKYLKELKYEIIGLDTIKNSIASQTMYLITNKGKQKNMLHTVIYGPPGVGKTTIGIKLAKIWYALGYLENNLNNNNENKKLNGLIDKIKNQISGNDVNNDSNNMMIFFIYLLIIYGYSIITVIITGCKKLYNSFGKYFIIGLSLLIIFLFYYIYYNYLKSDKNNINKYLNLFSKNESIQMNKKSNNKNNNINDNDIIKIVSRNDFVSGYLGQTAIKTKELLNKNLGKVLFIDEAYSLMNDEPDPYGMEAITTLNLFMSENPNKIVIIFAGYKDLLQNGIFKNQPGLVRRCMWHFECEGYTPLELFDIFKLQLASHGYKILENDYDEIFELITDNKDKFTSFAGDTEKLCFFSQLEYTKDHFNNNSINSSNIIKPKQIKKAIQTLSSNNINNDIQNKNKPSLKQMLEKIYNK